MAGEAVSTFLAQATPRDRFLAAEAITEEVEVLKEQLCRARGEEIFRVQGGIAALRRLKKKLAPEVGAGAPE